MVGWEQEILSHRRGVFRTDTLSLLSTQCWSRHWEIIAALMSSLDVSFGHAEMELLGSRHSGLSTGSHCEKEEEGNKDPGWEKMKAGVIQGNQALQSQEEFVSHCLFPIQLVAVLGTQF